jgi:putative intracellular protease/amidase
VKVAILIFDGLTALDAIGPYEVLRSVPGWEVEFVAKAAGEVRTDSGFLGLSAGSPDKAPASIVEAVAAASANEV